MEHSGSGQWHPDTNSAPLRSPKISTQSSIALSANAPEFVPRNPQPTQQIQQHSLPHHQYRNRGDNGGGGGSLGGSSGGGGAALGHYNVGPMVPHYQQQHDIGNGVMVNGTETPGKSSVSDRLKNLQITNASSSQQQLHGHSSYSDNKDIRNSSHYNHHQHHPNQHYSQQHRLQSHHQQPQQPQHLSLHQNQFPMAGMGYSSTALNNHLHHPILGGMAAAAVAGSSGPSMMPYDNRNKNNSSARSRHQNAQNLPMHLNQHHHHHQHQQQQQHQQHHHYQQHMSQHHPGGGNNGYGGPTGDEEQVTEGEIAALDYLTDVIAELHDRPGMFENMQRKLKNTFVEFRSNGYVLSNAVELIFEHSIKEQNFRYMGARLIQLLDSLDDGLDSTMRQCLNQKMDFQHSELIGFMQNEAIRVRGTTLFLAELYMQLRSTDNARNKLLAMRIINTATILLGRRGPENIKCVCQCLKLCGFELERDLPSEMMGILKMLSNTESHTDCSTERFIRSVLDLQQKSWGRSEEVAPITQPIAAVPDFDNFRSNSPVLYGPDGRELTEEENDFLLMAALPGSLDDEEFDDECYDLVYDEEFNAEIRMAYDQFCAKSDHPQL